MSRPAVLLVDDHKVVCEGLVRLLGDRCEIVGTINDGRLVLDAVSRLQPDVVILDLSMPHISGLEVTRQAKVRRPEAAIIVLTMHADASLAVAALNSGASAFVTKEADGEELIRALDAVLSGHTYLAAALTKDILTMMAGPAHPDRVELTVQQREVLRLLVRGRRAKEVAGALGLSTRTVEGIKYRMMQALNLHSTAELVRYAIEHDLVTF